MAKWTRSPAATCKSLTGLFCGLQPVLASNMQVLEQPEGHNSANVERVKDQEFFSDFYPGLKPLLTKRVAPSIGRAHSV